MYMIKTNENKTNEGEEVEEDIHIHKTDVLLHFKRYWLEGIQ